MVAELRLAKSCSHAQLRVEQIGRGSSTAPSLLQDFLGQRLDLLRGLAGRLELEDGAACAHAGGEAYSIAELGVGRRAAKPADRRDHLGREPGTLRHAVDHQEPSIDFLFHIGDPGDSWLRLRYRICDYWTGEPHDVDQLIYLSASRPPFGGLRWWFVCPHSRRRVRTLHLPLGTRRFACRRAYRLAYAS